MNIQFSSASDAARNRLTVLLVDAQVLLRRGVADLIDAEPDMSVIAQADHAADLLPMCERLRPDVVSVDLDLLGAGSSDTIRAIRALRHGPKGMVLTQRGCEADVYGAMCAGANGYLFKNTTPQELFQCLRSIRLGGTFVPPPVAAKLTSRLMGGSLSPREMQVLEHVAAGLSNKHIGRAFGISDGTVKAHTKRIFSKLGVSNRTSAVAAAVHRGLISL